MVPAVAVVALVALTVLGLLVWYVARRGGPRTWLWALLLALAVVLGLGVVSLALISYTISLGWWLAMAGCLVIVVALFVAVGRGVRWRRLPVLASLGVVAAAMALGVVALLLVPLQPVPLLEARAAQIADEAGFTALWPSGQPLQAGYQPVNALPEPCTGLSVAYERFILQESPSEAPTTAGDLAALVAPGATVGCEGPTISDDATTGTVTVQSAPAVTAEFVDVPPEAVAKPDQAGQPTTVLATELDGVDVVLWSQGYEDCSSGDCIPFEPLTTAELVAVADTLEPVG